MKRRRPSIQSHINHKERNKYGFCQTECLKEYMACLDLQKSHALQFHGADDAVEWLKRNHQQLLVGTIVIVAGIAFVTVSAGAGAAVLAPLVLVAG